jgi:hypothetical protein
MPSVFESHLFHLKQEHNLLNSVVVRNLSQHRRTRYFNAFRRAHKIVSRIIIELSLHGKQRNQDFLTSSLEDAAKKLLLLSRELGRRVTGGGFATLHAVLLGGIATYLTDTLLLRDTVCQVQENGAPST